MKMTEADEYSDFLKLHWPSIRDFQEPRNTEKFVKHFNLKFIGCGISRLVFKKKYSRDVIKIATSGKSNIAEYAMYESFNGCRMQSILAKCTDISKDGIVLKQEYLPKPVFDYALGGTLDESMDWKDFQTQLENQFAFIRSFTKDDYTICDMHPCNIRGDSNGNFKIIDYAAPLDTLSRQKKFDLKACIKGLSRYTKRHDQKIRLYLDAKKHLVLDLGHELVKMPYTEHSAG